MKSSLSKTVRFLRHGVKKGGATLSSLCLRSKSYPLLGIPSGVTEMDGQIKEVIPSSTFNCPPPISYQTYRNKRFQVAAGETLSPQETILVVKNGIATATGGTLTSRGKLITTHLTFAGERQISSHKLFYFSSSRFFPKVLKMKKGITSLTAAWQGGFYHWMYQILPRLELIDKNSPLYIDQSHPFQRETVKLLKLPTVIDASLYDAVYASEVTTTSVLNIPTPRSCASLRTLFLPLLPKKREKKRLYISREDVKTRRVTNEKEVWELLQPLGYEKVVLTKLPLLEQMALFHSAESVVSAHGAGLSHLVFCNPQASVIEFFHKNYVNVCYWHIASAVGLNYTHIFDTTDSPIEDADITVDTACLRKALDHTHR
ncbi:MAG: hypothetical protein S4CHLAM45_00790 [Chlamydiales bacterium]|nr:hypothetical protein [Chlamydiales bacterium]MCH9619400.1 hypothetical protein [Chlamydiales bacterium]MCH9622204.1 hypothetical protein [Chlamydiales bacterium]